MVRLRSRVQIPTVAPFIEVRSTDLGTFFVAQAKKINTIVYNLINSMKALFLTIIVLLLAGVIAFFAFQNPEVTTIQLFKYE